MRLLSSIQWTLGIVPRMSSLSHRSGNRCVAESPQWRFGVLCGLERDQCDGVHPASHGEAIGPIRVGRVRARVASASLRGTVEGQLGLEDLVAHEVRESTYRAKSSRGGSHLIAAGPSSAASQWTFGHDHATVAPPSPSGSDARTVMNASSLRGGRHDVTLECEPRPLRLELRQRVPQLQLSIDLGTCGR